MTTTAKPERRSARDLARRVDARPGLAPAAVVLAAGRGSRAGAPKGLVERAGETVLDWQIAALRAAGIRRLVVVLGHGLDAHENRLAWLPAGDETALLGGMSVSVAVNPVPERGQFSSLQVGLRALAEAPTTSLRTEVAATGVSAGCFVLPVDVPCPEPAVWHALAEGIGAADAAVPRFDGRGGHPVLLSRAFGARLSGLVPEADDARLDRQLAALGPGHRVDVPVDAPSIRRNLNRPEDFDAWAAARSAAGDGQAGH